MERDSCFSPASSWAPSRSRARSPDRGQLQEVRAPRFPSPPCPVCTAEHVHGEREDHDQHRGPHRSDGGPRGRARRPCRHRRRLCRLGGDDADAFVEPYAPDATVLLPGTFRHDREELRTAMATAFAGPLKGSRALNEVQSVRFPGEDTALVICTRSVVLAGEDEPREESHALDSWVLSASDGAWWVRGFHGCPARLA
ncbi:SgcJ/EcaC family oxidoreductase [Streptomyces sp. NBC_00715]|uniref:SgcJ/EcaC family oxidoreductase n=1 Tax=Streptomyces sp. NBC_00715 TaxID=2975811 RepID=UPI00386E402D